MPSPELLRPGEPVDLTNCDREPIHIPGSIQPHGALLAATLSDLVVVQASTNTGDVLGVAHGAVVGAPLAALLDAASLATLGAVAASAATHQVQSLRAEIRGRPFGAVVHRSSGLLVVELEPDVDEASMSGFIEKAREGIERMQGVSELGELWSALAGVVRALTGFDRVMIYRFASDGSGEVIADAREEGVESFLGLWYPASDIPQQARALYVGSRVRLIVDAAYVPVPIVPGDSPVTGAPLDLGRATLRSVSPIHCEYLANMGVRGSMSISLVHEERFWGLIACHHLSPRFVPYRRRTLAALIGDVASWMLEPKIQAEQASRAVEAATLLARLVQRMSAQPSLTAALVDGESSALALVDARGFAVVDDGAITTVGATPSHEQIKALLGWLLAHVEGPIYATDALSAAYPPAAELRDTASGLLVVVISRAHDLSLLWFRPEIVREVSWAGDPRKPVALTSGELTPRRSFALWKETVRGRSLPWAAWELESADDLRTVTAGVVLQKAAEIWHLNVALKRAVQNRDELVAMASHELRTPTTTLTFQLATLRRLAEADRLPRAEALARLDKAARQVDRIEKLIRQLLDVSRISAGHLDLERAPFELGELAHEVLDRYPEASPVLTVEGDTSGVWDRFRLDQVLTNLITNALKYGAGKPFEVTVRGAGDRVVLAVRDHGIGISAEAKARIFERFERAVPARHFAGFGLGLWIARSIVDQHHGSIEVESTPGAGSTFTVELPR